MKDPSQIPSTSDAEWFRPPSPREHKIAAALFVGFGIFFILMSVVWHGAWFRYVLLALAGFSILHGFRHGLNARKAGK